MSQTNGSLGAAIGAVIVALALFALFVIVAGGHLPKSRFDVEMERQRAFKAQCDSAGGYVTKVQGWQQHTGPDGRFTQPERAWLIGCVASVRVIDIR